MTDSPGPADPMSSEDLLVIPSPDDADVALVIGAAAIPDRLGTVITEVPAAGLRVLQATAAASQAVALGGMQTGRWVQLTAESANELARLGATMDATGSHALGVLRGSSGGFEHVLQFKQLGVLNPMSATLVAGLALQATLARIERRLETIDSKVDLLLDHARIGVEAKIASNLHVLRRQEQRATTRGRVDDAGGSTLTRLEPDVHEAYEHVSRWLTPLREVLERDDLTLPELVAALDTSIVLRDSAHWLNLYVWAEVALQRWELLSLVRLASIPVDSEELEAASADISAEAEHIRREAAARHEAIQGLHRDLTAFLDRDPDNAGWKDRLRVLSRRRLETLRQELERVLVVYTDALHEASIDVPDALESDNEVDPDDMHSEEGMVGWRLTAGVKGAIGGGLETGRGAIDRLSGLKERVTDAVEDRLPADGLRTPPWRRRPDVPNDPDS